MADPFANAEQLGEVEMAVKIAQRKVDHAAERAPKRDQEQVLFLFSVCGRGLRRQQAKQTKGGHGVVVSSELADAFH